MNEETKIAESAAKAGFTLIEIIIAIAIVGLMTAAGTVAIPAMLSKGRLTACRTTISNADTATHTYSMDHKLPKTQDEWVEALTGGDDPLIDGEEKLIDPWGNPLHYRKGKGNKFLIWSNGPDEEDNNGDENSDDLTNTRSSKVDK